MNNETYETTYIISQEEPAGSNETVPQQYQPQRVVSDIIEPHRRAKSGGGGVWKFFVSSLAGVLAGAVITVAITGELTDSSLISSGINGSEAAPREVVLKNDNPQQVVAIAEKAGRSVVGISVSGTTSDFFGPQETAGSGSGVIIKSDGYVLTNYHVIEATLDASGKQQTRSKVEVIIPDHKEPYKATIKGHDKRTDLAVLKIDAKNLPEIEWGDSGKLKVGQLTVAIGNPGGLELAGSVTEGVVSGLNRMIPSEYNEEIPLIQTSAAINPGNSGGALVDNEGKLIGINSSKITGDGYEGIGFAIPSNEAKEISDSLLTEGKVTGRPWFGVVINSQYNADMAKQYGYPEGLLVTEVMPFSGAAEAGIKVNDILISFDGVETKDFDSFEAEKKKHKPGDVVKIELYRYSEDRNITVNVTLTEEQSGQ